MKKGKTVLRKLGLIMIISIIFVILLESESLQCTRREIVSTLSFLDGKTALFSNIFLGIFASAFCMIIGELVNYKYLKKELENEIRELLDEMWIKISFKDGRTEQSYIKNSEIIIHYQDKIQKLYQDYDDAQHNEYYVIHYLERILMYYKAIYENEYMKNSNVALFQEYVTELLKLFNGDLKKFYEESEKDEQVMELRKDYERIVNENTQYCAERCNQTKEYIHEIKKIEKKINQLYSIQLKQQGNIIEKKINGKE